MWPTIGLIACLVLLVRPVVALIATFRTDLTRNERIFVGSMDPRGIVAASTAATFSAPLVALGIGGANKLLPATFLVIVGTVTIYGLGAAPLVRALGLGGGEPETDARSRAAIRTSLINQTRQVRPNDGRARSTRSRPRRRSHETLGEMLSDAQRVGDDGERGIHRVNGREEARVDDVEVVEVVGLAFADLRRSRAEFSAPHDTTTTSPEKRASEPSARVATTAVTVRPDPSVSSRSTLALRTSSRLGCASAGSTATVCASALPSTRHGKPSTRSHRMQRARVHGVAVGVLVEHHADREMRRVQAELLQVVAELLDSGLVSNRGVGVVAAARAVGRVLARGAVHHVRSSAAAYHGSKSS